MYGIKNHIPHDEDEIIPVVVIPLAQWQRLVFLLNDEITYGTDNVQEILDIIASVEVPE